MFKLLLIVAAGVGIFMLTPTGQQFRASAMDIVNPASNERLHLSDAKHQLDVITRTIEQPSFQSLSSTAKTQKLESLISQVDTSLGQAQDTAEKMDVGATISTLARKILPESWLPNSCPTK